jgi:uncharacterized protein (TIRG00374 family)
MVNKIGCVMNRRTITQKIIPGAFLLIVFIVSAFAIDWRGTYSVIRSGDIYLISIALVVAFFRYFIWSYKWQKTVSQLSPISFSKTFLVLMTGVFLNNITPGRDTGGEPIRALYISRFTGLNKRQSFATVLLDKSGNYVAIGSFIGFAVLFITLFMKIPSSLKFFLEVLILLFSLAVVSAVYVQKNLSFTGIPPFILKKIYYFSPLKKIRHRFPTYLHFEDYVMERISEFIQTFKDLLKEKKNVRNNLLLSYTIWLIVFIKTYLIFLAFGASVSIWVVIAVEAISILLGIISFMPGGAGATEVTMIALFSSAGVGVETATAVTIVSRGIYYATSIGIGYVSLVYLKIFQELKE